MDEITDSDVTMMAADAFSKIVCQVQKSGLNYQIKMTPFSAVVSMKKSFVKDKTGKPLLPMDVIQDFSSHAISREYSKLQNDLYTSRTQQKELSSELEAAYETIEVLKKINNDRNATINNLEKEILVCKEATTTINNAYNNNRIKFENEKIELFKQHKNEVKSWRRELGDMTKKHKNLERKFNSLKAKDVNSKDLVKIDSGVMEDVIIAEPAYSPTSEIMCTICSIVIDNYIPVYFCGHEVNPACSRCRSDDVLLDPFYSFPNDDMPSTLVTHWIPISFFNNSRQYGALSTITTLRSHYLKLPNPGGSFTSMEDLMQEFRVLLNKQSQAFKEDCRQS